MVKFTISHGQLPVFLDALLFLEDLRSDAEELRPGLCAPTIVYRGI